METHILYQVYVARIWRETCSSCSFIKRKPNKPLGFDKERSKECFLGQTRSTIPVHHLLIGSLSLVGLSTDKFLKEALKAMNDELKSHISNDQNINCHNWLLYASHYQKSSNSFRSNVDQCMYDEDFSFLTLIELWCISSTSSCNNRSITTSFIV
jgi:hypothetical protein